MPKLKDEIQQSRPFSSQAEEALLNLFRTADCLQRDMQRAIRKHGLTSTQYNVLRILRGAGPQGLTCSAISERMIASDPDITRLLGRLQHMGFIRQQRDKHDRRIRWTTIAPAGLHLLDDIEPLVQRLPGDYLGHLSTAEISEFIRLLELARKHCGDAAAAVSCEGEKGELSCDASAKSRS
ncbi:MAG: MarR family winged helix-turn-helix transcriptional regulator [Acidobacteriota bacterium]